DEFRTDVLVQMHEHFRVALRPKLMAVGDETRTERLEVVDFAVECDTYGAILVGHRLVAERGDVDDGEAAESQPRAAIVAHEHATIVRAAVLEPIAHRHDCLGPHRRAVERQFTAYSAHVSTYR